MRHGSARSRTSYLTGQVDHRRRRPVGHVLMPSILHTGLTVRDLDRSLAFYRDSARSWSSSSRRRSRAATWPRSSATRTRTCAWRTSLLPGRRPADRAVPVPWSRSRWARRRSRVPWGSPMSASLVHDLPGVLRAAARAAGVGFLISPPVPVDTGAQRRRPGRLPARSRRRHSSSCSRPLRLPRKAHEAAGQGVRGDWRSVAGIGRAIVAELRRRGRAAGDRRARHRGGRGVRRGAAGARVDARAYRMRRVRPHCGGVRLRRLVAARDGALRRARQQRRARADGTVARLPRGRVAALDRRDADRCVLLLPGVRAPARRARGSDREHRVDECRSRRSRCASPTTRRRPPWRR